MKKFFLFIIIFILSFCFTILIYTKYPLISRTEKHSIKRSSFSLDNPPKESINGNISSISGSLKWQSRLSSDLVTIKNKPEIKQGEEIETGNESITRISFTKIGTLTVFSNSHLGFIQTLPKNFLVEQKSGTVRYEKEGEVTYSIRAADLLIKINNGICEVEINSDNTIDVEAKTGSATLGFNNPDNIVTLINLDSGKKYIFDNNLKKGNLEDI